jgi:1-deoxy-D-xylulose-5-phosphate synthase
VFDLSYLRILPNMTIMAPKDENELQHMLQTAIDHDGPVAVRYPRGNGYGVPLDQSFRALPIGKAEVVREGRDGAILAVGTMVRPALEAAQMLAADGIDLTVVNARFVKPLDRETIMSQARHGRLFTVEENVLQGGFGTAVLELLEEEGLDEVRLHRLGYPDSYIEQGEQPELHKLYGLDAEGIARAVRGAMCPPGIRSD